MNQPNNDDDERLVKMGDIENDELLSYKKKNSVKNVLLFISLILIIGLVAFIIFLILKGKKDNEVNEDNKDKDCEPGFFIPDDSLENKKCEKCSEQNCDICKGTKDNNICLKCMLNYYLVNDKCKSYSFKATYKNTKINEEIKLFNNTFLQNINAMYMNNSEISKKSSYNFSTIGNHTIYFDMDISKLDSLTRMFSEIEKMVSIYFTPAFNTKNIIKMDGMFRICESLTSIKSFVF